MSTLIASMLLVSTTIILVSPISSARIHQRRSLNSNETGLDQQQPAHYCGCLECTESIWSRPAMDLLTRDTYTCGQRITYFIQSLGYSEHDACSTVAGEFPTVCGRQCNPARCDGRYTPPPPSFSNASLTEEEFWKENVFTVTPDTPLYCFPKPRARKQWTNVFGKYTVQAKEDVVPCGPGNNMFSSQLVSVRRNRRLIRMQYRLLNGTWTGSEVRIPACEVPFSYGQYSFSVKSISVRKASTNALVSKQLPMSLVLGMFTWDPTDDFATRENYNHEVDIEISQWNIPGNEDVQFLMQPLKAPQLKRFFSGGADGSIDHGRNHKYSFDWAPNRVDWNTTAGGGDGGYEHSYSTADAHYYGTPDYVQCLPADVEVRINLWNMLGTATPTGMADDDVVEVVIDGFTYTPSEQKIVGEGEACSKWCQCGFGNSCIYGFCYTPAQE